MKSYREELWLNVPTRRAFINITPQVEMALKKSGIREGLALIFLFSLPFLILIFTPVSAVADRLSNADQNTLLICMLGLYPLYLCIHFAIWAIRTLKEK